MNTTGCPAGFSTDMTYSVARPQLECQSSLVIFWIFVGILLVYRVLLMILQVRIAMHMTNNRNETQKKFGKSARVPLTTVVEGAHTAGLLVAWPLLGFNIINSKDGSGPASIAIVMFPFLLAYVLSSLKIVHLGHRVLPKSIRNQLSGSANQQQKEARLNSILADPVLVILFGMMISCMFLSLVFQVFIGLIYQPGTTDLWFRLGMGLQALACLCGAAIIYRQTYRVVHFINETHKKNMNVINGGSSGTRDKTLDRTVQKMKNRQLAVGIGSFSSNIFFWLCAGGVYTPWYFGYMIFIAAAIGTTGTTVMYMPSHMSICCCGCGSSSSGSQSKDSKDQDTDTGPRVTDLKANGLKLSSDKQNSAVAPEQTSL